MPQITLTAPESLTHIHLPGSYKELLLGIQKKHLDLLTPRIADIGSCLMRTRFIVTAAGLLVALSLTACAGVSPEQTDSSEIERPLTEQEQVMKETMAENRELLKEKLAEIDVREYGREQQLKLLMTALWDFSDAKVGHPIGKIQDISIVVDEEKTAKLNSSYKIYSLTFSDEWGTEYTGSLDELGGVGDIESLWYDPDTGMPVSGLGSTPIS
jgi:hypothetical protein